jgi:hypothetical protein
MVIKKYLKKSLEGLKFFSITSDAWTDGTLRKFVSITYHYVDREFKMQSFVGDIIPVPQQHNFAVVCREIALRIQNMVPSDAVLVATVTDNGANFIKMCKYLHTNASLAAIEGCGPDNWNEPIVCILSFFVCFLLYIDCHHCVTWCTM